MANLGSGKFVSIEQDTFNPQYGEVAWKPRLNGMLEERDELLVPIGYQEGESPIMQITQENTMIFINSFVDELDCVAIAYEYDPDGQATWYFRDRLERDLGEGGFEKTTSLIGQWALTSMSLYPMSNVVGVYETLYGATIPDGLDPDFK